MLCWDPCFIPRMVRWKSLTQDEEPYEREHNRGDNQDSKQQFHLSPLPIQAGREDRASFFRRLEIAVIVQLACLHRLSLRNRLFCRTSSIGSYMQRWARWRNVSRSLCCRTGWREIFRIAGSDSHVLAWTVVVHLINRDIALGHDVFGAGVVDGRLRDMWALPAIRSLSRDALRNRCAFEALRLTVLVGTGCLALLIHAITSETVTE